MRHQCRTYAPPGVIEIKAEAQFRSQGNRRHARDACRMLQRAMQTRWLAL